MVADGTEQKEKLRAYANLYRILREATISLGGNNIVLPLPQA